MWRAALTHSHTLQCRACLALFLRSSHPRLTVFGEIGYSVTTRFIKASTLHPRVLRGNPLVYGSIGLTAALQVLVGAAVPLLLAGHGRCMLPAAAQLCSDRACAAHALRCMLPTLLLRRLLPAVLRVYACRWR